MAKVTKNEVVVVKNYTVELSEEELKAIFWLVGKVGGNRENKNRKITDGLLRSIVEITNWNYLTEEEMFYGSLEGK